MTVSDKIEIICDVIEPINKKNNVAESVSKTTYYKDYSMFTDYESEEQLILDYIMANSTYEFQEVMTNLIYNKISYTIDDIADNNYLLDNEKIALSAILGIIKPSKEDKNLDKIINCENTRIRESQTCGDMAYIGALATAVSCYLPNPYTSCLAASAVIASIICNQIVNNHFYDCINK